MVYLLSSDQYEMQSTHEDGSILNGDQTALIDTPKTALVPPTTSHHSELIGFILK